MLLIHADGALPEWKCSFGLITIVLEKMANVQKNNVTSVYEITPLVCSVFAVVRQSDWRGKGSSLTPSLADFPDPGIEPGSPALQADSLPTELSG